jgi:hypothetical protein
LLWRQDRVHEAERHAGFASYQIERTNRSHAPRRPWTLNDISDLTRLTNEGKSDREIGTVFKPPVRGGRLKETLTWTYAFSRRYIGKDASGSK